MTEPNLYDVLNLRQNINEYIADIRAYDVNIMGTVNVCECIRNTDCIKFFVNVTADKVYLNNEWEFPYRETDRLDGYDP